MTSRKWAAAGSAAAVLTGGLFFGAPAATAAPGDAGCLTAAGVFNSALAGAGITAGSVARLEAASAAIAQAEGAYSALVEVAAAEAGPALEAGFLEVDAAVLALEDAEVKLAAAVKSADPQAILDAEAAVTVAKDRLGLAEQAIPGLEAAFAASIDTPEIAAAQVVLDQAFAEFEVALTGIDISEATMTTLLAHFKAFLAACEGQTGLPPVVVPQPVLAPAAPPAAAPAPVRTNVGLNIQTAAVSTPEDNAGTALLAGLLAAGIVVPAAAALRIRSLKRNS
ncbi:hypothetical protein E2F48_01895 [Arthrobacter crusticola]|uniref:LPXTG cell wall anchor domain-containing protein n=1 Tax=Arthrobacter crusticola TaxID=2547960 RepID=A0A4R5U2S2_9MICC|nr:hypothetical protein [Arthrobacter crusticola]TDK27892.1 hypothetical protein E2F48_01895 [Arthrobacter crusticola]